MATRGSQGPQDHWESEMRGRFLRRQWQPLTTAAVEHARPDLQSSNFLMIPNELAPGRTPVHHGIMEEVHAERRLFIHPLPPFQADEIRPCIGV